VNPQVKQWRRGDPEDVASWASVAEAFYVCDPGRHGAVASFLAPCVWQGQYHPPTKFAAVSGYDVRDGVRLLREDVVRNRVLVVESSAVGARGNAQTDIILARYAGAVIGAAVAACGIAGVRVVLVQPASWQAATIRAKGKREEKKARERQAAESVMRDRWGGAPERVRDPVRSAVCIAAWWASVCHGRGRTVVQGADGDG
jgi:hypothetical protein